MPRTLTPTPPIPARVPASSALSLAHTSVVGIDVAERHLDVHVLPADRSFRLPNDPDGHRRLIERLLPLAPDRIVLEATGGYETALLHALVDAALPAALVNPQDVRRLARVCGTHAKNDRRDAKVHADFGRRIPTRTVDPSCKIRHVLKQPRAQATTCSSNWSRVAVSSSTSARNCATTSSTPTCRWWPSRSTAPSGARARNSRPSRR